MPINAVSSQATKPPALVGGIAIITGTAVGAGMFSLPVVSSGMWFIGSVLCLVFSWFCMYLSALMILETNLNYPEGASFDTFIKDVLGRSWNLLNGISLTFVLYILTYAYISGGGSMVSHSLQSSVGFSPPLTQSGLLFALVLGFIVWFSTGLVGRITAVLIGGMVITFLLSVGELAGNVHMPLLLDVKLDYAPFMLAALPFYLTSFGFHGNVPSLMKYYGKDPQRIARCLLYGSLLSLVIYFLWQVSTLGNISREQFKDIIAQGGNIGVLVGVLSAVVDVQHLKILLNTFANLAVISSFLGVTLGLFDYIADTFGFSNSRLGRLKTAALTFIPPTIGGLVFPNGFIYAIGFAGLAATLWGVIIPALAVKASRKRFGNPHYQIWGGNGLVYFMVFYGVLLMACHTLALLGVLPVYGR